MKTIHIALLSAMPEEVGKIYNQLTNIKTYKFGDLQIHNGEWINNEITNLRIIISLAFSGWGKVSASRAITRILAYKEETSPIDFILFTGVAGAVNKDLKKWDIVVADSVMYHDMDARPFFKKFFIPALAKDKLHPSNQLSEWIFKKLNDLKLNGGLKKFGNIKKGLIISGDQFISDESKLTNLKKEIQDIAAVEMEGAAIAQVAEQEGIKWSIIRVISDDSNENASNDFSQFIKEYELFSWEIIDCFFHSIDEFLKNN